MTAPVPHPPPAAPKPWFHWRAAPLAAFGFALVALLVVALAILASPPRIVSGLPRDPGVDSAWSMARGRISPFTGGLRFESTLTGIAAPGDDAANDAAGTIRAATRALESARERRPRDARVAAALGHLALAELRYERAMRRYREAIDLAPTYGEPRLGLGVAMALTAETLREADRARGLRLRAIAQFAAVPEGDPVYLSALYDRAVLLARVGRADEARVWARRFRERAAAVAGADALDRVIAETD